MNGTQINTIPHAKSIATGPQLPNMACFIQHAIHNAISSIQPHLFDESLRLAQLCDSHQFSAQAANLNQLLNPTNALKRATREPQSGPDLRIKLKSKSTMPEMLTKTGPHHQNANNHSQIRFKIIALGSRLPSKI